MENEIMPGETKNILTNFYIHNLIMVLCTSTGCPKKKHLIENFEFPDILEFWHLWSLLGRLINLGQFGHF